MSEFQDTFLEKIWEPEGETRLNRMMTFPFIAIVFDRVGALDTTDHNLNPLFESQPSLDFHSVSSLFFHSPGHSLLSLPYPFC